MAFTTWNPSDKGADVTLSGGNLILSDPILTGSQTGCRATDGYSSGKFYFEITAGSPNANSSGIGIARSAATFSGLVTNGANGAILRLDGSTRVAGAVGTATGLTIANGTVIYLAVDTGGKLIWWGKSGSDWNGTVGADPATGTGGISFSGLTGPFYPVGIFNSGSPTRVWTANYGDTAFSGSVPSGFTSGWPVPGSANTNSMLLGSA